ncbi:MAG: hypothetical protein ACI9FN_003890 [Saprospiraceae bacterium]|jgi:hypothetical protein
MNWKKIAKYFLIAWAILTIVIICWMKYGLITMYGGHTTKVDHKQFDPYVGPVVINNVNILASDCKSFIANQNVHIEKGIIVSIDSLEENVGKIKVIDGKGKFLIPGLIDSHVHLFKSSNDLLLYTANGVTQIREMIGEEDHLNWRQEIGAGRIGPEMFIASPRIGSFGTLEGWFMSWSQGYLNITNGHEAEKAVQELSKEGYDAVKIYSQINKEAYSAVCKTAKELDMKIVGHVPWTLTLEDIYESGQTEIAHFEELMNALRREFGSLEGERGKEFLAYVEERSTTIATSLIASDIGVTSTLWLTESFMDQNFDLENLLQDLALEYENPGISEWVSYVPNGIGWLPEVNRFQLPNDLNKEEREGRKEFWTIYGRACRVLAIRLSQNGVKIMAGTDANLPPTVPGFSLHDELEALLRSGMSTAQVLQSATSTPATWLESNAGAIEMGRKANLVLLDKNPLEEIRNTRSINSVFANGKLFDRALLDKILKSVAAANDKSRNRDISEFLVND